MRNVNESGRTSVFVRRPVLSLSSFMLAVVVGLISSFTFSTAYDMGRLALSGGRQNVSGVWHGHWNHVRAVTVKLEQEGDTLGGTASFTRVINTEEGFVAAGESPELPLINPRFDGKKLVFELRVTDEAHPNIVTEMEMKFENDKEAVLSRTGRDSVALPEDAEAAIRMEREGLF